MTLGPDGVPIDGLPLVHTVQPQDVALPIGGEGVVLLLRPLPRPPRTAPPPPPPRGGISVALYTTCTLYSTVNKQYTP